MNCICEEVIALLHLRFTVLTWNFLREYKLLGNSVG